MPIRWQSLVISFLSDKFAPQQTQASRRLCLPNVLLMSLGQWSRRLDRLSHSRLPRRLPGVFGAGRRADQKCSMLIGGLILQGEAKIINVFSP